MRTLATIRPATAADAPAIAHVHVEAWRTAYRNVLPDHVLDGLSEEKRRSHWQAALSNPQPGEFVLVAEQDGQVVGFANGGPERDGDPHFTGEVYAIYLLDEFRRQGIGTTLFRRAVEMQINSGLNSMEVWVLRDNPYRGFYEGRGGELAGEKLIQIGGQEFVEVAYGWHDLRRSCQSDDGG